GSLAEPRGGGLCYRLVGKCSGARDNTDTSPAVDVAGHYADLALFGRDHAGAVRPDEARPGACQRALHPHHVQDRDAFGYADDQRHFRVDRLEDRIRGASRRHVDDGGVHPHLLDRFEHGIENREVQMGAPALSGRDAADHLGAVGDRLLGMEGALIAGESLADDPRLAADEHRHQFASRIAFTTFSAASARLSAAMIASPDSASIFLPSSTFVPSSRTTSGTCRLTSRAAATTPSAMTSQRMMPPKMLTRIASTFGSERMILNAWMTRSVVAPPPTSRKF